MRGCRKIDQKPRERNPFFQSLNSDLSERRNRPIQRKLPRARALEETPKHPALSAASSSWLLPTGALRLTGQPACRRERCPGASRRSARAESIVNTMRRRRGATMLLLGSLSLIALAAASDEVARSLTQLQSRDGRQQTQAARRLQDLSYEDPRAAARILEDGAAPYLVEVLTNGASLQAKVAAAGALVDVGGHGTSLRLEVTRAGAVEPAIALLDRDDDAAREVAAGLLVVAAPVARAAVVVPLVKMVGDTSTKASQIRAGNAAWALSRLADLPGLPLSMARAGAGEALKNALGAPRARRRAADAVTALAADEGVARELSDAGCGAALARALERTSATSDDMFSLVSALAVRPRCPTSARWRRASTPSTRWSHNYSQRRPWPRPTPAIAWERRSHL